MKSVYVVWKGDLYKLTTADWKVFLTLFSNRGPDQPNSPIIANYGKYMGKVYNLDEITPEGANDLLTNKREQG